MEAVVGGLLREKKGTLAVAESCTGGLIASQLTDVPGSSDYFLFSGVTYANQAKEQILRDSLSRLGSIDLAQVEIEPIVPSPLPFHYRNKINILRILIFKKTSDNKNIF